MPETQMNKQIQTVKQENFFEGLGFERFEMHYPCGDFVCYKGPNGYYYRVDHFSHFYTIECAENEHLALTNGFDDGDLYEENLPEEELVRKIREDLKKEVLEND